MKYLALSLVGLLCLSSYAETKVESFPGKVKVIVDLNFSVRPLVDILFVVDNSGSMATHQSHLAGYSKLIVDELSKAKIDYHAGVVNTSVGLGHSTGDGKLQGAPTFITDKTPDGMKLLSQRLIQGTTGSGTEQIFAPVKMALSEPLLSGVNSGFYRANASLALVVLTDAEDQGTMSSTEFVSFLKGLKSDLSKVTLQGLIVPTGDKVCSRDEVDRTPVKIEEAIKALSGSEYSLCSAHFENDVQQIASEIVRSGVRGPSAPSADISRINLPSVPALDSVTVVYGTQVLMKGDLHKGWVYDATTNTVVLGESIEWTSQPVGTQLEITYVPQEWAN